MNFRDDKARLLPRPLDSFWHLASQKHKVVCLNGAIRIVNEMRDILGELNPGLEGNCFA